MFSKSIVALLALVTMVDTAFGAPISYKIDSHHTQSIFSWNHFGFSNPSANFNDIQGSIVFDSAEPTKSSVDVTIATASIDTHVPDLDKELKEGKFLDATKFPTITFKSSRVEGISGQNKFKVTGDLSLHGVTKPVVLDAVLNKVVGENIGFNATTTLKRAEFGIDAYLPNISNEIKVTISTEASIPKVK